MTMDFFDDPLALLSTSAIILMLLLNSNRALETWTCSSASVNEVEDELPLLDLKADTELSGLNSVDAGLFSRAALYQFRLWSSFSSFHDDLGFWVKPRSTAWFSKFLLHKYDDQRWVQMFRLSKRSVFSLAQMLTPAIQKENTKYREAVPVLVRLTCTLFKLSHRASFLICSEMFAVGKSTVSIMLREVVHALDDLLHMEMHWPDEEMSTHIATEFQEQCGLPGAVGAIDGTHFAISKPRKYATDYYYFKSGGYSMNCQAVVDASKRFLDLYIGMPGSVNDARMLRRSTLFSRGQRGQLWDSTLSFNGFTPYLLGDGGYPLLPWIMVPHRQIGRLSMTETLFNRRLSRGRAVVENAFGMLKQTFQELHQRSDLNVCFFSDVVNCCVLLHNVLLKQSHREVETLLEVLRLEARDNCQPTIVDAPVVHGIATMEIADIGSSRGKRQDLGSFLSQTRIVPCDLRCHLHT